MLLLKKLLNINKIIWYWLIGAWLCHAPASLFAQNWQALGSGINHDITKLFVDSIDNSLYVSGSEITIAGGIPVCGTAKWNGSSWDSVPGICIIGNMALGVYNDTLYLSGNEVCKWNGNSWDTIATFKWGGIDYLLKYNNELYGFGLFDSISGIAASDVAKWNGANWSAIDTTKWCCGFLNKAILYKGDLYVGGNFLNYDGSIWNLAKWNGTQWLPVGNNEMASGFGGINCFAIYNNQLWIGGLFSKSNGQPGNGIACWNGSQWLNTYSGVGPSEVFDLIIYHGELYMCGNFSSVDGVAINQIAKWDGSKWCGLGIINYIGFDAMAVYNDTLYVAGGFETINGDSINCIAKWIGGNFVDTCTGDLSGINEQENIIDFTLYPNPATTELNISVHLTNESSILITINNILGETVATFKEENASGTFKKQINISNLSNGVYFLKVQSKEGVAVKKFCVER